MGHERLCAQTPFGEPIDVGAMEFGAQPYEKYPLASLHQPPTNVGAEVAAFRSTDRLPEGSEALCDDTGARA